MWLELFFLQTPSSVFFLPTIHHPFLPMQCVKEVRLVATGNITFSRTTPPTSTSVARCSASSALSSACRALFADAHKSICV